MTNSNTDKKIGRLKAGTWGRTSGGYSPAAAKQSKRAGSKGARRVAKDDLRKVSKRGRLSGDRGLYERISNIIESDPGGDTDKKTMALHNKRIEKEIKKKGIKTNWSVKETAEYLDIPENVVEDIREARKMYDGGRAAKTGWDCGDCGAEKNRSDQCRSCGSPKRHHVQKEEKYPSSLLLKGNKDAAKKSKAERQDEKQRKLERAKHDTGGFRISDADAKKAKARLKKKYGPYARHFREFNDLQELSPATLKRYTHKVLSDTPPHELDSKQMKNIRRAGKQIFKKEYSKTGKPVKDKKGKTVGLVHEQERVVESLSKLMSGGLEKARKSIKAAEKRTGLSVDASKNPIGQIGSFGRPQKKRLAK